MNRRPTPIISDWADAPEAERRKVRRLASVLAILILIDAALAWGLS